MLLSEFDYELPEDLIAQLPADKRENSRMLVLNRGKHSISHKHFYDIVDLIEPNSLLVLNNTTVLPARLYGTKETGAKIDIEEDGTIHIFAVDQESGKAAKDAIEAIVKEPEVGEIYNGLVKTIQPFGAFVEILPGKDGLCHISKLANHRVEKVEDVVSLGDVVKVVCLGKDKMGRISFSIKDAQ